LSIIAANPFVRLCRNSNNVGFASACNQGIALTSGEYFVLLNPDVILCRDSLDRLARWLDLYPDVGIVGPQSMDEHGCVQPYRTTRPGIIDYLASRLFPAPRRNYSRHTDWVSGFCMMARRTVFDNIGGLDEGYFMYSEDVDWCLRARDAGWKVVLLAAAAAVHSGGGGHSARVDHAARIFNVKQSYLRLFARHRGRATYLMMKGVLAVESLVKLGWDLCTYPLTSRQDRATKAARMFGYRKLLQYLGGPPRFMLPATGGSVLPVK
jgi:GT2 family glycosyltransferase